MRENAVVRAAHRHTTTTIEPPPPSSSPYATVAGMHLLAAGVPLTLLLDLALPVDFAEVVASEGGKAGWLHQPA